eukprot:scaffold601_cov496-Prasinococcus_capsulatus_cf.AAC.3
MTLRHQSSVAFESLTYRDSLARNDARAHSGLEDHLKELPAYQSLELGDHGATLQLRFGAVRHEGQRVNTLAVHQDVHFADVGVGVTVLLVVEARIPRRSRLQLSEEAHDYLSHGQSVLQQHPLLLLLLRRTGSAAQ